MKPIDFKMQVAVGKPLAILAMCIVIGAQYWIAMPHLYESTTFLADQLDQILHVPFLLKGNTKLFYGPYWSGTDPPVYGLGFIPSLFFGIPGMLGADPETIHFIQFSIIAFSSVPLIVMLRKINGILPWIFLGFLLMNPSYWWALTLFWINSFLPAMGLIFLSAYMYYLTKPSLNRLVLLWSAFILPLHIHSTPIVAAPAVIHSTIHYIAYQKKTNCKLSVHPLAIVAIIAVLFPFIAGEFTNGFYDTKSILYHLQQKNIGHRDIGLQSAQQTFAFLFDPVGISYNPFKPIHIKQIDTWIGMGLTLVLLARASIAVQRRINHRESIEDKIFYIAPFIICSQWLFFYILNRPILSGHYSTFILPYYILLWAIVLADCLTKLLKPPEFLAIMALIVLIIANRSNMLHQEKDQWTFAGITAGMNDICKKYHEFQTIETGPFVGYQPEYETVLRFIVNRYFPKCTAYGDSGIFLYPQRTGHLPDSILHNKKKLVRIKIFSPNIGIYVEVKQ